MDRAIRTGRQVPRQTSLPVDERRTPPTPSRVGSVEAYSSGRFRPFASEKSMNKIPQRIYGGLLKLYPGGHRSLLGAEMTIAFEAGVIDCRTGGSIALARFILT